MDAPDLKPVESLLARDRRAFEEFFQSYFQRLYRFVFARLNRDPVTDASFDVAVLSLALHDMPRRVRLEVLREACRVTRERIVILDYDFPGPRWLRRALIGMVGLFETAYFKQFATEGLRPLLEEAGLRPIEVARLFPPLFAVYVVEP